MSEKLKKVEESDCRGTEEMVCPHCGFKNEDSYNYYWVEVENKRKICSSCKQPFKFTRYAITRYSTAPMQGWST